MIRVKNGHVTLVLANRQLVLGIAMLMLLMWLFAVVTYLVSQVASPSSVAAAGDFGEQVIFVDSPVISDGAADGERQPPGVVVKAKNVSAAYFLDTPGEVYLQLATLNSELAGVYVQYLAGRGIPAFASAGSDGEKSLLMVGPVGDKIHLTRLRGKLRDAGLELN